MATTQATLSEGRYGTHEYDRGDLLRHAGKGKVYLRECPFCASDPARPRYHFKAQESRPEHIRGEHAGEGWV